MTKLTDGYYLNKSSLSAFSKNNKSQLDTMNHNSLNMRFKYNLLENSKSREKTLMKDLQEKIENSSKLKNEKTVMAMVKNFLVTNKQKEKVSSQNKKENSLLKKLELMEKSLSIKIKKK
eukprot:CAMPEP_0170522788 /NCGR_PEP_ID=MMETSP0209-20121228/8213_1 /TAXON_ID=665100 ORGANISM="Litonotus pictus, Strain P1" /NCGR_SAMPLE_ID=MMETSP0209 /ASSEMBLY_ACC=CAM_ASM_000301 /LENGTH=118 /DNA_ID=CAMNT_0010810491 /DNA_START=1367 /DNA_END=1723 /DNA_ORIENTATION=-